MINFKGEKDYEKGCIFIIDGMDSVYASFL